jgi:malate permease and related proteins
VFWVPTYFELLALIAPIFLLIALGAIARMAGWLTADSDGSLLKLVVNVFYPALIFKNVLGNPALADPRNVFWPPLVGFVTMAGGILLAWWMGRVLGLSAGKGLRTFAFAVGIFNYGYIPIPVMESLFGPESIGVLLVHNVGCEVAIWTVGVLVLSGLSLRDGWRRLLSGPVIALLAAGLGNALDLDKVMPAAADATISMAAACAIPVGLIAIGSALSEWLRKPAQLVSARVTPAACFLRLLLFPALFLALAKVLPISQDLKRVMMVEAAMPAGIIPILIARHYGGQPLTAVQVVLGTTAVGLIAIPLWLRVGLAWIG